MEEALLWVAQGALAVHLLLITTAVHRIWRGKNSIDRLIGVEMVSTLFMAILALLAIIERDPIYIDVALGLAALSFIGVIALAKYAVGKRIF